MSWSRFDGKAQSLVLVALICPVLLAMHCERPRHSMGCVTVDRQVIPLRGSTMRRGAFTDTACNSTRPGVSAHISVAIEVDKPAVLLWSSAREYACTVTEPLPSSETLRAATPGQIFGGHRVLDVGTGRLRGRFDTGGRAPLIALVFLDKPTGAQTFEGQIELKHAEPLQVCGGPRPVWMDMPVECGNGLLEDREVCDDGNAASGDGCHQCRPEADVCTQEGWSTWSCPGEGPCAPHPCQVGGGDPLCREVAPSKIVADHRGRVVPGVDDPHVGDIKIGSGVCACMMVGDALSCTGECQTPARAPCSPLSVEAVDAGGQFDGWSQVHCKRGTGRVCDVHSAGAEIVAHFRSRRPFPRLKVWEDEKEAGRRAEHPDGSRAVVSGQTLRLFDGAGKEVWHHDFEVETLGELVWGRVWFGDVVFTAPGHLAVLITMRGRLKVAGRVFDVDATTASGPNRNHPFVFHFGPEGELLWVYRALSDMEESAPTARLLMRLDGTMLLGHQICLMGHNHMIDCDVALIHLSGAGKALERRLVRGGPFDEKSRSVPHLGVGMVDMAWGPKGDLILWARYRGDLKKHGLKGTEGHTFALMRLSEQGTSRWATPFGAGFAIAPSTLEVSGERIFVAGSFGDKPIVGKVPPQFPRGKAVHVLAFDMRGKLTQTFKRPDANCNRSPDVIRVASMAGGGVFLAEQRCTPTPNVLRTTLSLVDDKGAIVWTEGHPTRHLTLSGLSHQGDRAEICGQFRGLVPGSPKNVTHSDNKSRRFCWDVSTAR